MSLPELAKRGWDVHETMWTLRKVTDRCLDVHERVSDAKVFLVRWFVRLVGLPCLAWGLFNLWQSLEPRLSQDQVEELHVDAGLRVTGGAVLGLVWFFLVRGKKGARRDRK